MTLVQLQAQMVLPFQPQPHRRCQAGEKHNSSPAAEAILVSHPCRLHLCTAGGVCRQGRFGFMQVYCRFIYSLLADQDTRCEWLWTVPVVWENALSWKPRSCRCWWNIWLFNTSEVSVLILLQPVELPVDRILGLNPAAHRFDGDRDPWEPAQHQSVQGTTWHSPTADLVPDRSICTEEKWKKYIIEGLF